MSTSEIAIKLWQTAAGGAKPADGFVGAVSWRVITGESLTRREKRLVARRRRLVARAMRRLRDRHDRCWLAVMQDKWAWRGWSWAR